MYPRSVRRLSFALLVLAVLFGVLAAPARAADPADLFFENGVIYTVDAADRVVEALAVRDGRIVFVGSRREGEGYIGAGTRVVDLGGKLMLPGFCDSHVHTPGTYVSGLFDFDLTGILDPGEAEAVIREYVEKNPEQEIYWGIGYESNMSYGGGGEEARKGPKKERLDAICPDRPMLILASDGHAMWLNSKALELSGIDAATPDPQGGRIERDDESGEPWGTLKDMALTLTPRFTFDTGEMVAAVKMFQAELNSYGVTSIFTVPAFGGVLDVPLDALRRMDRDGGLTVKVRAGVVFDGIDDFAEKEREIREIRSRYDGDFLKVTAVKFFVDGAVNMRTAHMLEPYADDPDNYGIRAWEQDRLNEAVAAVNAWGLQAHIHAVGDAAVRAALDACAYAARHAPAGDYRNAVTHLQIVDPADIGRFAALGVVASTQPYWHFKEPDYWESEEYTTIGERAERQYPLASLHETGALLAFSSDTPVSVQPNPLAAIQIGVTRNLTSAWAYDVPEIVDMDDPTYLLNPAERLPVREMIRGFTANGAYATFADRETGTLEVGKAADLAVFDTNILEADPLRIEKAKVLRTYVDGKLVYGEEETPASSGSSGCDARAAGLAASLLLVGWSALGRSRRKERGSK